MVHKWYHPRDIHLTLLAKAAVKDLEIDQIDVNTAFLNPDLKEEIYIQVLDYFELVILGITKSTHYL